MQEHEVDLWTTKLFNAYLASPLDSLLTAIGRPPANPAHPWENWITMEILVVLIIMVLFAYPALAAFGRKPGQVAIDVRSDLQFRRRPGARCGGPWLR